MEKHTSPSLSLSMHPCPSDNHACLLTRMHASAASSPCPSGRICTCTSDHTRMLCAPGELQSAENPTSRTTSCIFSIWKPTYAIVCVVWYTVAQTHGILRGLPHLRDSIDVAARYSALSRYKSCIRSGSGDQPRRCAEHAKQRSRARAKVNAIALANA